VLINVAEDKAGSKDDARALIRQQQTSKESQIRRRRRCGKKGFLKLW
jgi:hypothetical protein